MTSWMYEDDTAFVKILAGATGADYDKEWARQGQAWDAFVTAMWAKRRPTLPSRIDGWKRKHDESYYRTAIKKSQEQADRAQGVVSSGEFCPPQALQNLVFGFSGCSGTR